MGNHHFCIALAQTLTSSDGCLVLQVCILPTQQTRHYLRYLLASYLTTSSSLCALWRAGPLCCRSLSYHTLSCENSAFVMAVISLLCSQVELRWNSTASHCVPIFRTLKKKNMLGFEEVKWSPRGPGRAWSVGKYRAETQWEQSCPSVSFLCSAEPRVRAAHFAGASFLTELYCFTSVCLPIVFFFFLLLLFLLTSENNPSADEMTAVTLPESGRPSGFITRIPPSVGYANKVWEGGFQMW